MNHDWRRRLHAARSESDILGLVRDFVAHLDFLEVARLRKECRPGKFFDREDVAAFALEVIRSHLDNPVASPLIIDIIEFFSAASHRLLRVSRGQGANDDGDWAEAARIP